LTMVFDSGRGGETGSAGGQCAMRTSEVCVCDLDMRVIVLMVADG
jgi:hypothetical protein